MFGFYGDFSLFFQSGLLGAFFCAVVAELVGTGDYEKCADGKNGEVDSIFVFLHKDNSFFDYSISVFSIFYSLLFIVNINYTLTSAWRWCKIVLL